MVKINPYRSLVSPRNVAAGSPRMRGLPRTDMNVLSDIGSEVQNVLGKIERKNLINEAEAERLRKKKKAEYENEKRKIQFITYQGKLNESLFNAEKNITKSLEGSIDWANNTETYSTALKG